MPETSGPNDRASSSRCRAQRALAALLALGCAGCAVNGHGLVRVTAHETPTGRVVRWRAWGAHLTTVPGDSGLTLGRSDRTYFFPLPACRDVDPAAGLEPAVAVEVPVTSAHRRPSDFDDPLAIVTSDVGIGVRTSASRFGLLVGAQHRSILRLPSTFTGTLALSYDSARPDEPAFTVAGDPR